IVNEGKFRYALRMESSNNKGKEAAANYIDDDIFTFVHRVDDNFEFKLGMMFNSEDEAFNTYNAYARNKGFGVRKGQNFPSSFHSTFLSTKPLATHNIKAQTQTTQPPQYPVKVIEMCPIQILTTEPFMSTPSQTNLLYLYKRNNATAQEASHSHNAEVHRGPKASHALRHLVIKQLMHPHNCKDITEPTKHFKVTKGNERYLKYKFTEVADLGLAANILNILFRTRRSQLPADLLQVDRQSAIEAQKREERPELH
ncbi:hypothetical protein RJ639_006488, partial [Escallonia herrerae]